MGSLFHADKPQILGTAVQNLLALATRRPRYVQPSLKDGLRVWLAPFTLHLSQVKPPLSSLCSRTLETQFHAQQKQQAKLQICISVLSFLGRTRGTGYETKR